MKVAVDESTGSSVGGLFGGWGERWSQMGKALLSSVEDVECRGER
jgi:hypothetical protein